MKKTYSIAFSLLALVIGGGLGWFGMQMVLPKKAVIENVSSEVPVQKSPVIVELDAIEKRIAEDDSSISTELKDEADFVDNKSTQIDTVVKEMEEFSDEADYKQ